MQGQFNPLENLFGLVHTLKRQVHADIEQLHLDITPMHVRVLKIISSTPQCTANDIARFLSRDKAQVTRLLSTLFSLDYLQKQPNPNDKRSQLLVVTSEGAAVMKKIREIDAARLRTMTQHMTEADQQELQRLLGLMLENLQD
ncbi:MarR family winged helix-turn-helix transcriptional regulator [Ferrimonas lipolytica]|uniref:MarR family transcriptional regulator n=1 Tax=Ferrimonas lipolytica TaxID=2724191 RepID=A0A6H1UBF9_9GAMM|nr:MarR family transcriptional regulator [Ferrimonas lipolytica]QIZ76395.1 MarR family transcriptional regulator [Ferrimonas lipolytica]